MYKRQIDDFSNKMYFSIMPSTDNLPLTTMTENAQFKLNLSWEPQSIKSGSTTTFYYKIFDAFYVDRQVSGSHDLSIFHDGEEFGQISDDSAYVGFSMVEFDVPDNVSGIMTLQFENLNGSDLANAILPVVVNRISVDETSIPVSYTHLTLPTICSV